MSLMSRPLAGVLALGAMLVLFHVAAAQDAAAQSPSTQPSNGTVQVTVNDQDGKAVEGASVTVTPRRRRSADPSAAPTSRPTPVARGKTDSNGLFTADDVPPGNYTVSARNGDDRGRSRIAVAEGDTIKVTIQLGSNGGGGGGGAPTTTPTGGGN
jgi:Carboxypeptidase regulatory-like domain